MKLYAFYIVQKSIFWEEMFYEVIMNNLRWDKNKSSEQDYVELKSISNNKK